MKDSRKRLVDNQAAAIFDGVGNIIQSLEFDDTYALLSIHKTAFVVRLNDDLDTIKGVAIKFEIYDNRISIYSLAEDDRHLSIDLNDPGFIAQMEQFVKSKLKCK